MRLSLQYGGISSNSLAYTFFDPVKLAMEYLQKCNTGGTPRTTLHEAAISGDEQTLVTLLQQYPGFLNQWNCMGFPPLHCAAASGQARIVELLLQHGVDPDVEDSEGRTANYWARLKGYDNIAEMLLRHQSDSNNIRTNCQVDKKPKQTESINEVDEESVRTTGPMPKAESKTKVLQEEP